MSVVVGVVVRVVVGVPMVADDELRGVAVAGGELRDPLGQLVVGDDVLFQ